MAYKHKKRCSTSYIIRETQIKMTMRYHYTPIKMAKIQSTDNTRCQQSCGTAGTLIHYGWEWELYSYFGKWVDFFFFLIKLNTLTMQSFSLASTKRVENLCPAGNNETSELHLYQTKQGLPLSVTCHLQRSSKCLKDKEQPEFDNP